MEGKGHPSLPSELGRVRLWKSGRSSGRWERPGSRVLLRRCLEELSGRARLAGSARLPSAGGHRPPSPPSRTTPGAPCELAGPPLALSSRWSGAAPRACVARGVEARLELHLLTPEPQPPQPYAEVFQLGAEPPEVEDLLGVGLAAGVGVGSPLRLYVQKVDEVPVA